MVSCPVPCTPSLLLTLLALALMGQVLRLGRSTKARRLSIRKSRSQQGLAISSEMLVPEQPSKRSSGGLSMFSSLQNVSLDPRGSHELATPPSAFDEPVFLEPGRTMGGADHPDTASNNDRVSAPLFYLLSFVWSGCSSPFFFCLSLSRALSCALCSDLFTRPLTRLGSLTHLRVLPQS